MNIVYDWPPEDIGPRCTAAFGLLPDGVLFAYGDTIYYPNGCAGRDRISTPLKAHEYVHCEQQGEDPSGWWEKYLADPRFRLQQEVEAHQIEWVTFKSTVADPNEQARYLMTMAARLASPMYGKLVTLSEAKTLIRGAS